jgi:carbamoyltransferase
MAKKKYYIGLACTYHDPAIAIVDGQGKILFAEATERSIQIKRAPGIVCDEINLSKELIKKYCPDGEEYIISYTWEKSYLYKLIFQSYFGIFKFKKAFLEFLLKDISPDLLSSYDIVGLEYLQMSCINQAGVSFSSALKSLVQKCTIKNAYYSNHLTHAAYACYTSPFEEGICVIMDGFGEKGSLSIYNYNLNNINSIFIQRNWASLGFFYGLITRLCGFDYTKGEHWKVMGLAPYGKLNKTYYELLQSMVKVKGHSFKFTLFRQWINALRELSLKTRINHLSIYESADIAYTGQLVFSEIMVELLNNIYRLNNSQNLIYSGGCALNSSFNGQILKKTNYKSLHIPPAPADDGNALGAALFSYYIDNPIRKSIHRNHSPYLGSDMSGCTLNNLLKFSGIKKVSHLPKDICERTALLIAEGKMVGWVQGRAEFGPRALGNRSILADPRSVEMKDKINNSIKFREEFRPFAPSILHEFGPEYFENYEESPFMERTLIFKKEMITKVPAVVHVDNSGRLQSVTKDSNHRFYDLIHSFYLKTGIPLVLNTSFNIMGKPIVHSVEDVISVFFTSGLDVLVIDDYLIEK